MIQATRQDKSLVVELLTKAFDDNKSVNYVVGPGGQRVRRIRGLMAWSFDNCFRFGKVFLSDDKRACVLVLLPDRKQTTLGSILRDLKLALLVIGPGRLKMVLQREAQINAVRPADPAIYYLCFIGVAPDAQHQGAGRLLLQELLADSQAMQRRVYLETSVPANVTWYQRQGFEVYQELHVGYPLYCLRSK